MATNEAYKRGWIVPLTVGNNVAVRTPVCVSKIAGVTLTKTDGSSTEASVLRHGAVDVTVDSACDAVTLTLATVTNSQTIIFDGITYTAATATTTWNNRTFSIAGNDAADATLLCKAINGGEYVTLTSCAAGDKIVVAGLTYTAHATTTTAANREFSVAGTDTQDATELVTCLTDATYGIGAGYTVTQGSTNQILIQPFSGYPSDAYPKPTIDVSGSNSHIALATLAAPTGVKATVASNVVTLKSSSTISAVTGTASGATVTVDHSATSTMPVSQGSVVSWTTPSTLNLKETATHFGTALEKIEDRKMTLASVAATETVIINGITFTAHATTTTKSSRQFSISGTDTQDGDELCACINDPIYGLIGFTATNSSGTITLAYDGDIAVTGTARTNAHLTTAPGSRKIRVKLGY